MNDIKLVATLYPTFHTQISTYILSILGTPPPTPSPDANLAFYGAILAAIIGAIVAIAAIIVNLLQFSKSRKYERENQRIQQQNDDLQRRLEKASQNKQFENEIEKLQYENVLAARRETLERERQRKASTRDAARAVMVQARTLSERAEACRKALHADTNISQLQILDMSYPMEVTKVYVRLRLHLETRLRYDIDTALLTAEERGDPNSLIKARHALLETRSQAAMTPEEALKKYPRCIVLGDPGAGKSTLLKYLTLQSVDQQLPDLPDLPVHIALGDFASSTHQDLLRFAAERWDEWYGFPEDEAYQFIESRLSNGSAILLLDALDETVIGGSDERARDSYARVLAAINRIARAERYSKAPIVVTARKAGYHQREHLSGFTELEVLDFRPQEIEEFVNNWFKYHPVPPKNATASELNAQLIRNPRIQSLASNPLLLSLIVMVYELHLELPERRADIYKQCVDLMLFRWDTSRDIRRRRKFKAEHKQDLLTEIAWYFHTRGRRYFPEDELLQVIAKFLPTIDLLPEDSKDILQEIEEENGLLKEQAHGWHGFLHLTLQEYFVAQYLCNVEQGLSELLKHCGDPWWEEVMLLYVGSVRDASPLLRELLRMEKRQWLWQDIFHTSLLWAGQCLAAKPRRVQREIRDEIVSRLFRVFRRTPYNLTREHVTKILLNIDRNDARDKLLRVLKDRQEWIGVRRNVLGALVQLGDKAVVPDLLAFLKETQEESYARRQLENYVRGYIPQALGQLGDKSVVPDLLALLRDRQAWQSHLILGTVPTSRTITSQLMKLRFIDGLIKRVEKLDRQRKNGILIGIAQALGQLGDKSVVPDLLVLLKDRQEESSVRRSITQALGQLRDKAVLLDLLVLLKDRQEESSVRRSIAQALGQLRDKAVLLDLLVLLKDRQEESSVRRSIAQALGQLRDKAVVPDLLALLKDKQEESGVRKNIAQALRQLGDKAVVPDLLALLKDKQEESGVRGSIAQALGQLGDKAVVPDLLALLKDKQEESGVRGSIAQALGQLGDKAVVPDLLTLLKDKQEESGVRTQAAKNLIKMGQQEAVFPYLSLIVRNTAQMGNYIGLTRDFMWNDASIRVCAQLLRVGGLDKVFFLPTLWQAAQREKVRILMFRFGPIKLVRVVKH